MSRDLEQLLEATASAPTRLLRPADVVRRARRQRTVRSVLASVAVVGTLLGAGLTAALLMQETRGGVVFDEPQPAPEPAPGRDEAAPRWAEGASFEGPTGTVLLFDDGLDGVIAVDLDAGQVAKRVLDGQRPGDAPYRLWRIGDDLVVGWERIYAVALATGESRLLGEATVFVPAAEPGHVWLVDHPGEGPPTYRLVDLVGDVQLEAEGVAGDASAAGGVLGGLAVETPDGVAIWDGTAGEVVRRLGDAAAFVADTAGRTVVWCEDDCSELHVTDLEGNDLSFAPPTGYEAFDARSARLSPDGDLVAAIVGDGRELGDRSTGTVVVIDTSSGRVTAATPPLLPRPAHLGWSPDGTQLFFSAHGYGAAQTDLGRYLPGDERSELATLPLGGTLSFAAVGRGQAGAFLEDAAGFE